MRDATDGSGEPRDGGHSIGPFDRCWRCRTPAGGLREVDHPDPAIDRRVQVCADGCWLPESASYRCHGCDERLPSARIRLVRAPTRANMLPECLACNRAVLRDDGSA